MDRILVHICCGVDSVYALRKLKEDYPNSEIVGYFYDPNIHPEEEFELRWIETKRVCDDLGIECIKGDYELETWLNAVKGYENEPERGERCTICHDLRLSKSAQVAKQLGCNKITTVLMMSPKKDFEVLKEVGEKVADEYGIEFLAVDFRKNGGTQIMNQLSKESQLYHQNYCGCIYGLFGQRKNVEFYPELVSFGKGRLAGSREELLFTKQVRLFAESLGLKCKEEEFSFIGWRVLSSSVKLNKDYVDHKVLPYSATIKGIVRATVLDIKDNRVVLNKENVEVILTEELKEPVLQEPRIFTKPTFILPNVVNVGDKLEFQLKTEFDPSMKSQNLYIGNLDSFEELKEFYSDTDSEGKQGYTLKEICNFIEENKDRIKEGQLLVVVYGANLVGQLGKRMFPIHNLEF
ncbi:MAG: epoxyqueuosine reductase QueH [Sulfurihydrogenibium sp.]|uniref:epoxyqueuosine reductase QueH n=1 Tax=Sulfurihydrogenibium sp. TaxID=2053621 RepID=UPI003D105A09